ncbi:hypothetical protein BDV19DRAFT_352931 [Aspergillus venezuelensis]
MASSSAKYTCDIPGCGAAYSRKEHLNRHKAQHLSQQSYQCPSCERSFKRNDTLRRHMRLNHQDVAPIPPTRQACVNCRAFKSRCEGGHPCINCLRRQIICTFQDRATALESQPLHRSVKPTGPEKVQRFLKLYFELFHPHWPFIHQPSFFKNQSYEKPLLVQSMIVIGMWVANVRSMRSAAVELYTTLNSAIYEQRKGWDATIAEGSSPDCDWPLSTYQAILLHIIFSLLYKGRTAIGLDLRPSVPAHDISLFASLVQSCRKLGMLYYPKILARYRYDHDISGDLPYIWVGVEEHKRFNLTLYKVSKTLSSQPSTTDTNPDNWYLHPSELQFPLPKNERLWHASTREEWASAAAEDEQEGDRVNPYNLKESEWISKSAALLRLI